MPSRVGPRHAGQSVVERARGDAGRAAGHATMTQTQATRCARIVLFFIRLRAGSVADPGKTGKPLDGWVHPGTFRCLESMKFRLFLETWSQKPSQRAAFRNEFSFRAQG